MSEIEEVIRAARDVGLACLGGQAQFQFPDGTCEAYWLSCDPEDRSETESWEEYVRRSAKETESAFRRIRLNTNFREVGREWGFIRKKMEEEGVDPLEHLRFVLYFDAEPTS